MTIHDLTLLTWVPAVLALIWHVRGLRIKTDNLADTVQRTMKYVSKLEDKTINMLADIDRIETRLNTTIQPQLEAIIERIRPKPDECRHEFRLVSTNNPYLFQYRCSVCNKTEDIDAGAELAKRYLKTGDQP